MGLDGGEREFWEGGRSLCFKVSHGIVWYCMNHDIGKSGWEVKVKGNSEREGEVCDKVDQSKASRCLG